jgi:predicted unusual protein kinase regulating ubiquinone biosynthesis (AarF/ABC1/UbiB family)
MMATEVASARREAKGGERPAAHQLAARLASLQGIPQKLGQVLGLGELASSTPIFDRLAEGPAAIEWTQARTLMEFELGGPLSRFFDRVSETGIGASLGQTHPGALRGGQPVAIKVQYPWAAAGVKTDLQGLGLLTHVAGGWRRGFDLEGYRRELAARVGEELDYRREADSMRAFAFVAGALGRVKVPRPVDAHCTARLLVMDWVEGEPFRAALDWSRPERESLARTLLRLFGVGALRYGLVHGDPHPGNYRFQRVPGGEPVVGLLDFGCVQRVPAATLSGLQRLLSAVASDAPLADGEALAAFSALGFDEEALSPLAPQLMPLARELFKPLAVRGPVELDQWKAGEAIERLLGEHRWTFRFAGPPSLLLLMRAFQGLLAYLKALGVPLDWRQELGPLLESPAVMPPLRPEARPAPAAGAQRLRVRVTERGELKVDLTFRAAVTAHLSELMPDELLPRLEQRGIDLGALAARAIEAGLPRGELFGLDEPPRQIRVWLE